MSKENINDRLAAARASGKTTTCTMCKKPMVYCGRQPADPALAVCASCVTHEAKVVS